MNYQTYLSLFNSTIIATGIKNYLPTMMSTNWDKALNFITPVTNLLAPITNSTEYLTNSVTGFLGLNVVSQKIGNEFLKTFSASFLPITIAIAAYKAVNSYQKSYDIANGSIAGLTTAGCVITQSLAGSVGGAVGAGVASAAFGGVLASAALPLIGAYTASYLANAINSKIAPKCANAAYATVDKARSFVDRISNQSTPSLSK